MQIPDLISSVQKRLKIQSDGKAGPETWAAIYAALAKAQVPEAPPRISLSRVDDRSERNIATLLDEVRPFARALVQKAAANGIEIKVISGLRTYAEQDGLYAKGRTTDGPKVTNARGGYSSHNFGIAFDIGVFSGTRYFTESSKYKAVGVLGTDLGLDWGGNWTSFVDEPHFQLRPRWASALNERAMMAELRKRVHDGLPIYV